MILLLLSSYILEATFVGFYVGLTFGSDLATERERQSAQKGLNATYGAKFAALPLVEPVV